MTYIPKTMDIITSPLTWNQDEWFISSAVLGSASVAYFTETNLNDWIIKNQNNVTKSIGDIGYTIGHPLVLVPLTGLAYTAGYFLNDPRLERAGLIALESLVLSGVTTKGIKMAFHRQRPRSSNSNPHFDGPALSLSEDKQSFPSGHSALAWATATAFALEYKENNAIVLSSYGWATFVSISRLFDNAHWASDVIIGAAIGHYIARYTFGKYNDNENSGTMSIRPILSNEVGLEMKLCLGL